MLEPYGLKILGQFIAMMGLFGLVVQPTVSWQRAEYAAHGIPFERRGRILDEHLAAMRALWSGSPAEFHGELFDFADVWSEPKAWRPDGRAA